MSTQIKAGDTVRVTRQSKDHGRTIWEGVLTFVDASGIDHGFCLHGQNTTTGEPANSWFAGAPEIQRCGIAQTVTLLAS